jgi:hypothetical protein
MVYLIGFLLLAGVPPVPNCTLANQEVEAVIGRKAAELQGAEYCQFRRYNATDDLDGDGVDDLVVLFTVESVGGGGNGHVNFMAVFLSTRKPGQPSLLAETGRRGLRDPREISVRDHRIILKTAEYSPGDPLCCPSGHGELVYVISGQSLRLVTKAGV